MSSKKPLFDFRADAISEFPELSRFPEFGAIPKRLLHFILRFYDFALRPKETDYEDFMEVVADHLHLTAEERLIASGDEDADPKKLREYTLAVARFLRLQDNRKWALYCAYEDQFWQNIASMRTPLNPNLEDDKRERALTERAKNRENTEVLRRRLEEYDRELWPDPIKDVAAKKVKTGLVKMSPENMAKPLNGSGRESDTEE